MEMIEKNNGDARVLAIIGRLDTQTAPELEAPLGKAIEDAASVELDCSQLEYISSAGLRVLLVGQKAAIAAGKQLCLTGVTEEVQDVLDLTGFSDFLTIR